MQDINNAVNGKLDVRIEELDGSVQEYQMDTANIPYLTRPGSVRYKLTAGRPSDAEHNIDGPLFAAGEFSWGSAMAGHCTVVASAPRATTPWHWALGAT
ncbi:fimbria/pilus outer membrane usher protein [Pseudomonas hygromyciniae]|uniref:Fimbria/pilus outer membrane usher protein n=1 Tax=Pseudomonas hygromyciniae TaxID=2812000 RepID=A0ABX7K8W2_9PSED|nr:fimbria/pilus outer membrane usher protein [Pseudomonas hygromyciniae]